MERSSFRGGRDPGKNEEIGRVYERNGPGRFDLVNRKRKRRVSEKHRRRVAASDCVRNKVYEEHDSTACERRPYLFNVKIESDGRLAESWTVTGAPFDTELLIRAEKATLKEAKRRIKTVLGKMQKEYHADVAGFGNRLRIENPKAWKKVKKDWDEVFSSTPIQYDVKINISDYGTSGPAS